MAASGNSTAIWKSLQKYLLFKGNLKRNAKTKSESVTGAQADQEPNVGVTLRWRGAQMGFGRAGDVVTFCETKGKRAFMCYGTSVRVG